MPKNSQMKSDSSLKRSILVVEDDKTYAYILERRLSAEGYKVTIVTNGPSAVPECVKAHPDLILLDIFLPQMDGLKVLALLKSNSITEKIPVIILTVLDDKERTDRALEIGAVAYIVKGQTTLKNVIGRINEILRS